ELREQPLEHGQVELGLAAEVVEERRLAEPRRLGDLAHADALEAAPGEQHLGDVEDLVARAGRKRRLGRRRAQEPASLSEATRWTDRSSGIVPDQVVGAPGTVDRPGGVAA